MYTLIGTAKLNDVDPQTWLADILARIPEQPQTRLHELLPWHWKAERQQDLVGTTKARGRYDRHTRRDQPKKDICLRPLRKDWQRTLNR